MIFLLLHLQSRIKAVLWIAFSLLCIPAYSGDLSDLKIQTEENLIEPFRGLAYTKDDVATVRRLAAEHGVNSEAVREILTTAQEWLERSDETIIELVPKPGAAFAHGYAGDPKTGKAWPTAGRGDLCSFAYPGEVRSPFTGDVYGIQKPGEMYYDPGDGWVRPSDGRRFYFKALWNSFVARKMHEGVDALALAYLLTGAPETARKALLILDQLATLRKLTPEYKCMIDSVRMAEAKVGFFCYQGNLANQRVINTALAFDLIARAPAASGPSSGDSRMTVFENIATHYFDLYEREYYLDKRGSLTNHGTILFGNILAQGVLFGKADFVETGIEALYAFIDSTINRDGDYLELAGGYGRLGRDYGSRLVALLNHYHPSNYANAGEMPDPSRYPHNLRIADERRWYATVVEMLYRLPVLGRYPQYGDVNPDRDILLKRNNRYLDAQRRKYLRMYHHQTTNEEWKREVRALYRALPENRESRIEVEDLLLYGLSQWTDIGAMAESGEAPAAPPEAAEERSELMGGKAIAILRSGAGENRRALFMRGGSNGPHGHDDQMAIVPYGHGMVLTGVYGYASSETPDHLSWGSRAISHLVATINEDLPGSYLYKGFRRKPMAPAGTVSGFAPYPPAQFVEMHNPDLWAKTTGLPIEEYRRTAWMVDVDKESYYYVDIFNIIGGETHDYPWNAPYAAASDTAAFTISGVSPKAQEGVWTLASLSGAHHSAYWNQPGKSWGERLDGKAGVVKPLPKERNQHLLSGQKKPPLAPGNGYGMIWNVKSAHTANDWQATWKLQDGKHSMRASFVNYDSQTVVTGRSPTLTPGNYFNLVVARRSKAGDEVLKSRFANVMEVGVPGEWTVANVARLPLAGATNEEDAAGVEVRLGSQTTDYLISSRTAQSLESPALKLTGRNGFARIKESGALAHLLMSEGTSIEAGGWKIETARPSFEAEILSVTPDEEEGRIVIAGELPEGTLLEGATLLIRGGRGAEIPYTHDEYYALERVEKGPEAGQSVLLFRKQSLIITRLQVETIDAKTGRVESRWPSENAGMQGTHYLQGRAVYAGGDTPIALIKDHTKRHFDLTSVEGVQSADKLRVAVAKSGDRLIMPAVASFTALDTGDYLLRTNATVQLSPPDSTGLKWRAFGKGKPESGMSLTMGEGRLFPPLSPSTFGSSEIILQPETP